MTFLHVGAIIGRLDAGTSQRGISAQHDGLSSQAEQDLRRLAEEQAALRRVAVLVAAGAPPDQIFAAVAQECAQILDVVQAYVSSYDRDGASLLLGTSGYWDMFTVGRRYPPHPGVNAEVWRTGLPAFADYERLPGEMVQAVLAKGMLSAVGVPIIVDGATWGVVVACSTRARPLPQNAEARLTDFTELLATAVSNAQARDDLQRLADEQAALRRVAVLVAEGAQPDEVFAAVAREVAHLLDAPAISMVRFEADETSTAIAVWGDENPFGVGATFEAWPGVMLQVRTTGCSAKLEDFAYSTGPTTARLLAAHIHSGVGVPITVEGRVWGTIIALATGGGSLPEGIEPRLSGFTQLIATAIANTEARDNVRLLAEEQSSLRRVATLVADGASSADVFAAVAEEVSRVSRVPFVEIARFDSDGTLTVVGHLGDHPFRTGTRWPIDNPEGSEAILSSGQPARIEFADDLPGVIAETARKAGIRWGLSVPIVVDGKVWGSIGVAGSDGSDVPEGVEARLAGFTELVATAISNTTNHSQLLASRARIVAATDETRRRIERNLHDGTQQRLVALGLRLQTLQTSLPAERPDLRSDVAQIQSEIGAVVDEVRELSRGLHPPLLAQGGIASALRALARRSPIPVALDVSVDGRLPESIELALYFVISEALANVSKHARATSVAVAVSEEGELVRGTVEDDGIGGAVVREGSGLIGLIDRVEALGGQFSLDSPPGAGTRISIELPLEPSPVQLSTGGSA